MATTDVEGFFRREGILLTVDDDHTIALAAVDNAEFTIVHEVFLLDVVVDIEAQLPEVLELEGLGYWHGAAEDEAVVMRVGEEDGVGSHHLFHDKALAEQRGVVVFHVFRMAGGLELHMLCAYEPVGFLCLGSRKREGHCPNDS